MFICFTCVVCFSPLPQLSPAPPQPSPPQPPQAPPQLCLSSLPLPAEWGRGGGRRALHLLRAGLGKGGGKGGGVAKLREGGKGKSHVKENATEIPYNLGA